MAFLDELELIAHSPLEESAAILRQKVIEEAEGLGIVQLSEGLYVHRDRQAGKITIDVRYELHIKENQPRQNSHFGPRMRAPRLYPFKGFR